MSIRAAGQRLKSCFVDREFIMRSQGQVRFLRVSARAQMRAAAGVGAFAALWLGSMAGITVWHYASSTDRAALLNREAKVEKAENRLATYRKGLDGVADDLGRRQAFIEKMVEAHLGQLPANAESGEAVSDSRTEAAKTVAKVSAAIPEAAPLAKLEARQLAFVEQLTRYADRRAGADAARMQKLGLNPQAIAAGLDRGEAMGGPLIQLATSADGSLDPRFQRLGASLARMTALEDGLTRLPQVLPARLEYISSGFGYRSDPFTHAGAFHPGLDFKGPMGAPIYAAARGVVSFAGQRSGYGNCIEVTHGPGLVTRYAHMSAFRAHQGEAVTAGQQIGAIGSTGRSTGPHLHFEVRINDHPVNPRPFLESLFHVPEKTGTVSPSGD